jgi:hypothetical protein
VYARGLSHVPEKVTQASSAVNMLNVNLTENVEGA